MSIASKTLEEFARGYGIILTPEMLRQFELYADILMEYNKKVNLTAITKPEEIVVKHFLDSLLPLKAAKFGAGDLIIDVGTGAGFPGIPLKILEPEMKLTLLDSLNKRVGFLVEISQALGQNNTVIHGRAERHAHLPDFRECFDLATARAVAALPALCEYCLPFVRPGGYFVALKGPDASREALAATTAITVLGGRLEAVKSFLLPLDNERNVVVIRKISQTPAKYPRTSVKIPKKPL